VERAMEQLQRNMGQMAARAARQQERFERRMERERHRMDRWAKRRPAEPDRPGPEFAVEDEPAGDAYQEYEAAPGPDLDEERLSILRMLEQGQIAPEEAEMLLDALQ
jgi:hypothetical protein